MVDARSDPKHIFQLLFQLLFQIAIIPEAYIFIIIIISAALSAVAAPLQWPAASKRKVYIYNKNII